MKFISVCSGIEAASVAWEPLGWKALCFAEIEKFPSAVLKHHYPKTPNHGDMTKYHEWPDYKPDLICGGTPCQAFSVAGLRQGLADPRGNLTLTFLGVVARYMPRWVVWENVPGVLSSISTEHPDEMDAPNDLQEGEEREYNEDYEADSSHALSCFMDGLQQLGYGVARRIIDAQYCGIPQRRRRVIVVGHIGDWTRAASVLFEPHSLQGNPPPSRKAGQEVAGTISSRTSGGGGLGTDFDLAGGVVEVAAGLRTNRPGEGGISGHDTHLVPVVSPTLNTKSGSHHAPDTKAYVVITDNPMAWPVDVAPTLNAHFGEKQGLEDQHINGGCGLFVPGEQPVCITGEITHALKAEGADASEDGTGRGNPIIAFNWNAQPDQINFSEDSTTALTCSQGPAIGFQDDTTPKVSVESIGALRADAGGQGACVSSRMQVRRLTPLECERLQGFPEHYTQIPYGKKPSTNCPDGPRYKALGNSWAVPVFRWVGERIAKVDCESRFIFTEEEAP